MTKENPLHGDSGRTAPTPRATAPLTLKEVTEAFGTGDNNLILTLKQAAALIGLKPSTLKRKVSEGHFKGSVKRGKPLLFWKPRFILQLWNNK